MTEPATGVIVFRTKKSEITLDQGSGDVLMAFPFVDNGTAVDYYPSGQIKYEISYQDGVRHGAYKHYNEEGSHLTETTFSHGNENGLCRISDPHGVWEALVLKGEIQEANQYTPEGRLVMTFPYVNGLCHGDVVHYNPEGKIVRLAPYVKGKKNGTVTEYNSGGMVTMTQAFQDDKAVGPKKHIHHGYCVREEFYESENNIKWLKSIHYDAAGRKTMMQSADCYTHFYDYETKTVREVSTDPDLNLHGRETVYDMDAQSEPVWNSARSANGILYMHGERLDLNNVTAGNNPATLVCRALISGEYESNAVAYKENQWQVISPANQALDEQKLYSLMALKPFVN